MAPASRRESILTHSIGRTVARREQIVDTRTLLAYSAAIGAESDQHMDDARDGGIEAASGFVSALDWPLLLDENYLTAIGVPRETLFDTLLHAYQDTIFFEPIVPDMKIASELALAEVKAIAAGVIVTARITGIDCHTRNRTHETWYGSLFRNASTATEMVRLRRPDFHPIDCARLTIASSIDIPRTLPHVYSECSRIWNPLHTERLFALKRGFPDIVLHGSCTWALAAELIASKFGAPSKRLRRLSGRFAAIVVPGQTLMMNMSSPDDDGRLAFQIKDTQNVPVLTHGLAIFK